jgi:hypothetical protein
MYQKAGVTFSAMHFKLIYENHWNFGIHVADTLLMLKYALEAEGHGADIEKNMVPGFCNIVLENFSDEFVQAAEQVCSAHDQTCFIIVATEFLIDGVFNQFKRDAQALNTSHYDNAAYWQKRYDNFLKMLPLTSAIWHLSEQQVGVYKAGLKREDIYYLPHIYSDRLYTVRHRPDDQKDIDFVFTGTLTDYRKKVLYQLETKGYKVVALPILTAPFHREDIIARSKVALNIKQYPEWQHPSNSRFYYHIMNRSMLVSESTFYECDLSAFIDIAEESLVETCIARLAQGSYTRIAETRAQQLKNINNLPECFKHLTA